MAGSVLEEEEEEKEKKRRRKKKLAFFSHDARLTVTRYINSQSNRWSYDNPHAVSKVSSTSPYSTVSALGSSGHVFQGEN